MAENIDNNIMQEIQKAEQFNQKFESEMNNILKESGCAFKMAVNIDNNIMQEIQKAEQFNQKFESEMNNILKESDCVLNNAETELNKINDDEKLKISRDLLKNYYSGQNISSIAECTDIPSNESNETIGPSLQVTIKNVANENEVNNIKPKLLYDAPTFEGCSKEFTSNVAEQKITVVVDVEKGRSVTDPTKDATINIDVNSNNLPVTQKITLKRPASEANEPDVTKKIKHDVCDEISIFDHTETQYTQVIFDDDETADANDPKWSQNSDLSSIEDHFESVRQQWRSMALPNPHKNLTTRFLPGHLILKYKPEKNANTNNVSNSRCMSCVNYLDHTINRYTQKVNALYVRLNYLPQSNRGRSQRNKILKEIDELQKFVIGIVKNREEIQQNFMFYEHPNNTWNANYLTRIELDELKEQEKLLEFQKRFYTSK